jgi:curved DNA-binding protein
MLPGSVRPQAAPLRTMAKTGSGVALVEYKDYYQTLGVERQASAEDIKKAYRKLVRKYHPDVSKAKDADRKTKEINEAYGVLGDADKRAAYDALGSGAHAGEHFEPPPDWAERYHFGAGQGDHDDFFADLFAHVGRRNRAGQRFAIKGDDIRASMAIDLADAYQGATRTVSLTVPYADAQGRIASQARTLTVHIPQGVMQGQQLRLAGQGHPGSGGGPPGDLYLEVQFSGDPRYRVEGRDVYEEVAVAPWEAALGGTIDVPTPSGQLQVSVPAGSQSGRKLRLRGRGLPGQPAGDLYLVLDVVLPPATSDRARELYRTMAREMPFNPRAGPRAGA